MLAKPFQKHSKFFFSKKVVKEPKQSRSKKIYPVYSTNSNRLFCALSITTTGPNPLKHEMIILKAIAADRSLTPVPNLLPFSAIIRPEKGENILSRSQADSTYLYEGVSKNTFKTALASGLIKEDVLIGFFNWAMRAFPSEMIRPKFIPLVINWGKMYPFLLDFFGWENDYSPHLYDYFDVGDIRDFSSLVGYYSELFYIDEGFTLQGEHTDNPTQKLIQSKRDFSSRNAEVTPLFALQYDRKRTDLINQDMGYISRLNLDILCDFFNIKRVDKNNAYYEPLALLRLYPLLLHSTTYIKLR